ncbi:MAG: hypothetical protein JWL66_886 [Sphingomonadales bacterium]|nr:hypothetical protein [Sphingomonadales bacterium]
MNPHHTVLARSPRFLHHLLRHMIDHPVKLTSAAIGLGPLVKLTSRTVLKKLLQFSSPNQSSMMGQLDQFVETKRSGSSF